MINATKPMSKVKPEQWILILGVVLLLVMVVTALTPDTGEGRSTKNVAGSQPIGQVNQQRQLTQQQLAQLNPQQQVIPQTQNVAGLQAFKAAPPQPYQGVVNQVVNRDPGGWGQIHIILKDGTGNKREISLAPAWYMEFQGCVVQVGKQVQGEIFRFGNGPQSSAVLYAKNIIINGVRCRLRTVDGFALWTDQLR